LIDLFVTLLWFLLQKLRVRFALSSAHPLASRKDQAKKKKVSKWKILWKRRLVQRNFKNQKIVHIMRTPAVCLLHP
jgi:hypothetical protein